MEKLNKNPSIFVVLLCIGLVLAVTFINARPSVSGEHADRFLISYDSKWDIICEPYVVKIDDWVYKIFRRKGAK